LENGAVRTVAGTGAKAHRQLALGAPTATPLRSPWAVAALGPGLLLIAMAGSHQIWALVQEEQIGPFAGNGREALVDGPRAEASFNQPSDLALGLGHLLVADAEASAVRAVSLDDNPAVITLVGQGLFEFGDRDGKGAAVRLQHPTGLAFGGRFAYLADSYNHKIKRLDPTTGEVSTLIGSGAAGHADGPLAEAQLFQPEGLAFGAEGEPPLLYIADTNNHLIRVADLRAGTLSTLTVRGLERLPAAAPEPGEAARLPAVTVRPGPVNFTLDLALPVGYKRNPEAPVLLRVAGETHAFAAGETPAFRVDVDNAQELAVDLTVYYCEAGDARLCLIHDRRLVVPVQIAGAAEGQISLAYAVPPEAQ
jgi:hypothetical protein